MLPPTSDGLDRLLSTLEGLGADGIGLPAENLRVTLCEARELGWPFEQAWSAAINRLQPSQIGGIIDPRLDVELRESRAMLEEDRPYFRALYEGREQTSRERAERIAAAWPRIDQALTPESATPRRRRPDRKVPA